MHHNKKHIGAGAAVAILTLILVLFFTGHYPVVVIGDNFISASHVRENEAIARKMDPNASAAEILNQLVTNEKMKHLTNSHRIKHSDERFENELNFITNSNKQVYQELLNQYFEGNKSKFEEFVVAPQVYRSLLQMKYNSDFSDAKVLAKAQEILNQLDNGKSFEELAKTKSADKISRQLGGDLGFVSKSEILPELFEAVETSRVGEVNRQIIISRAGYHIVYPVETTERSGEKVWHLKHILIESEGFDQWLKQELDKVNVWRLMVS